MVSNILHLLDETSNNVYPEGIEIYMNDKNRIFFGSRGEDPSGFFFTISHLDWIEIKKFIDDMFEQTVTDAK